MSALIFWPISAWSAYKLRAWKKSVYFIGILHQAINLYLKIYTHVIVSNTFIYRGDQGHLQNAFSRVWHPTDGGGKTCSD